MSKTAAPTMLSAEHAAEVLGLDVLDLAVALRQFAVGELERQTLVVSRGDERPNLGRFQRLLRAAEACEAAWDETLAAAPAEPPREKRWYDAPVEVPAEPPERPETP